MNAVKKAPPKVVLDTNTVLSALLFNQSKLSQFRALWQSEKIIPLTSKATISELIRVLAYPKFKLTRLEQQVFLAEYLPYIETITTIEKMTDTSVCRDTNDTMFLELALAGKADYLIKGDKDLLEIQQTFKFKIITPAGFISEL
jgi:uncharacterized protein